MVGGRPRRRWTQVALTSLLAGAVTVVMAGTGWSEPELVRFSHTCQPVSASVSVPGGGSNLTIAGDLCWKGTLAGKPLQILTSGFTYDRTYWDFPEQPQMYSYVVSATMAGYATFSYDRLGVGGSDLPSGLPDSLTIANQADVLHQLVQDARTGLLAGTAFSEVVSVGHSMGSAISLYEAGFYGDVDALVLTGNMNELQPDFTGLSTYAAVDDPKFAGSGLPLNILTTVPGERSVFFFSSNTDPSIMAAEEDYKATGALAEVFSIPTAYDSTITDGVDVPVLFVIGQNDFLFCNTAEGYPCDSSQDILNRQAPMLPNAPCVDAVVIGGSGHSLNLHFQAQGAFATINGYDWRNCS